MRVYTRIMKKTASCHCTRLRSAAQTLTEIYDRALEPSGLKITQYILLQSILQNEAKKSITELAQELGSDRSTLGRNLRILARDGLVFLSEGNDRREHIVQITEKGRQAVDCAYPLWQEAQAAVADTLGQEQLEILKTLLSQVEKVEA